MDFKSLHEKYFLSGLLGFVHRAQGLRCRSIERKMVDSIFVGYLIMRQLLVILLTSLFSLVAQGQPVAAKEAFQLSAKKLDPNTVTLNWDIKPGYFLYSDRIKVSVAQDSNVHLGPLRLPPTLTKTDKQGHTFTVYRNQLVLPLSILNEHPGETLLDVCYQGCSDDGFCYPPALQQIKLSINKELALTQAVLEKPGTAPSKTIKRAPQNKIAELFATHNWVMILITFYGFGLLLSFTPCILPMVPVLSGIIVGHGLEVTTRKAFFLSLSYVLSMSATYAVVGAFVALLGANLQISMQSPWAVSLFSIVFVLLALSMFGFYEFKLPDSWQSKIAGTSRSQRGGHYWGAAIMGSLSTLILSPCVTAPLIGVLTYIAQTHNVVLGSLTLFFLSLGMGTPLLLIGTSAGKWLPESGAWMNAVKAFFGVLLLAVAIYLMSRVLAAGFTMLLWACLLVFSGIYAGALTYAKTNAEKFAQGLGLLLLVYGALILVGVSAGSTNPLQPLRSLQAATPPEAVQQAQSLKQIKELIVRARGKPIMLDFYADWCASCKVMEATTLSDPKVKEALSHFELIKIDVTANSARDQKILDYFHVIAPPTYIFFNAEGEQQNQLALVGEVSVAEFLVSLDALRQ
jgi:thiol:disulfide interchange protein DsbD